MTLPEVFAIIFGGWRRAGVAGTCSVTLLEHQRALCAQLAFSRAGQGQGVGGLW